MVYDTMQRMRVPIWKDWIGVENLLLERHAILLLAKLPLTKTTSTAA